MSRTTYGEHRHQTMAKVVVDRWIKTTTKKVGAIAYKRLATVVISQEKVKCFGSRRSLWEVVAHKRLSHFDSIYFRMDHGA